MNKFHVNPKTGKASECHALKKCPFGGYHFDSLEEARGKAKEIVESDSLWEQDKALLESKLRQGLDELGYPGIRFKWEKVIEDIESRNIVLAKVVRGLTKREIILSEDIRFLSPYSRLETLVHELAHLKAPRDWEHGVDWDLQVRAVIECFPEWGIVYPIPPNKRFKPDERQRLNEWRRNSVDMRVRGVCDNSHEIFAREIPRKRTYCDLCGELRTWERKKD